MKIITLTSIVLIAASSWAKASYVDLMSFGSSQFTLDPGGIAGPWTQSAAGVNINAAINDGYTVGGTINGGPLDFGSYDPLTDFAIKLTVTGANPNLPFTLTLFDSAIANFANFQGSTFGATTDSYIALSLSGPVTPEVLAALGAVGGAQFTFDGNSGSANVTVQSVAAVPEPSTYALLALGAVFGAFLLRHRSRA
jgi:hypothetical protein